MPEILTRPAHADDAADAVALLRRSIIELCVTDHQNDAATLASWLANKTIERFGRWLADPDSRVIVAEQEGAIRGVGSIHKSGEVRLCYVLPGAQRLGIGSALLAQLEQRARAWGVSRVHLTSSTDARAFYESSGYAASGPAVRGFGISSRYPYAKVLNEPTPTETHARTIASAFCGREPASVTRFPTGLAHWVYDVAFDDGARIVVRLTKPAYRRMFEGAVHWSELLRPLGVPLPALLEHGEAQGMPYLVLERIEGDDLGVVYTTLSRAQKAGIAREVVRAQSIVSALPEAPGFGSVCLPDGPYETTWRGVIDALLDASAARIASAKLVSTRCVERVRARADQLERYFTSVRPKPFLDDTTVKNVLVHEGRLSGIVDVDELGYGDAMLPLGLTRTALFASGRDCDYTDAWCEALALSPEQHDVLRFYTALYSVVFLSEQGEAFNRAQAEPDRALIERLERLLDEQLGG